MFIHVCGLPPLLSDSLLEVKMTGDQMKCNITLSKTFLWFEHCRHHLGLKVLYVSILAENIQNFTKIVN